MDNCKNDHLPCRPRTALFRLVLSLAEIGWNDHDEESETRFTMRPCPWRVWETYLVAGMVAVFAIGCGCWLTSCLVTWWGSGAWLLLPIVLLSEFILLQMFICLGSLFAKPFRIESRKAYISAFVLVTLALVALLLCYSGDVAGWIIGLFWLIPVGFNSVAALVERFVWR